MQSCYAVVFRCVDCDICLFCDEKCRQAAWFQYHRWECYGLQRHFWKNKLTHTALRMLLLGLNTEEILLGVMDSSAKRISDYRCIFNLPHYLYKKNLKELNTILLVCTFLFAGILYLYLCDKCTLISTMLRCNVFVSIQFLIRCHQVSQIMVL